MSCPRGLAVWLGHCTLIDRHENPYETRQSPPSSSCSSLKVSGIEMSSRCLSGSHWSDSTIQSLSTYSETMQRARHVLPCAVLSYISCRHGGNDDLGSTPCLLYITRNADGVVVDILPAAERRHGGGGGPSRGRTQLRFIPIRAVEPRG